MPKRPWGKAVQQSPWQQLDYLENLSIFFTDISQQTAIEPLTKVGLTPPAFKGTKRHKTSPLGRVRRFQHCFECCGTSGVTYAVVKCLCLKRGTHVVNHDDIQIQMLLTHSPWWLKHVHWWVGCFLWCFLDNPSDGLLYFKSDQSRRPMNSQGDTHSHWNVPHERNDRVTCNDRNLRITYEVV